MPITPPTTPSAAPRLRPLEPPFDPHVQELLTKMNPPAAPSLLALFRVLALNPMLAERATGWGGYLLGRQASLPLRDREVVIDRVCARCGAEYEWGVHVAAFAEAARFSPQEIACIADAHADLSLLPARDRLLVRMVDELHLSSQLSDALWSEIAVVWSPPQIVELLMLAGWYRAIAYVCNAGRVPLEDWQRRFADFA
ncbi:4-carboxymuconolactone decarboxylase [Burkholderiaceae bacterium]|nr:4-carboxymuconolactone decarboxylase [Burkholderiaceae bacterium]